MQKQITKHAAKQFTGKRAAAFVLAAVMTVAFMPALGAGDAAAAAKPKGRLVKTVTKQYYEKGTERWVKDYVLSFKYNMRNDPSVITKKAYNDSGNLIDTEKWTQKYTYKKGKRVKRTEKWTYDAPGSVTKWTYDKYGNPKTNYIKEGSVTKNIRFNFTKSGYLKSVIYKEISKDDGTIIDKYKYKTTLKKGLVTKMTCFYYDNGTWKKDSVDKFNKKGFITNYKSGDGIYYHTVKYTYKKGRAASATVTYYGATDGVVKERYKFAYTKKPVKNKRYAKMINHLIESYDEFAWY